MKKRKRRLCVLIMLFCMAVLNVAAYAETVGFTITIPKDTLSKKAGKSNDCEQKFYVTGAVFNSSKGILHCTSWNYNKRYIYSKEAAISLNYPANTGAYADVYATGGEMYYMSTYCTASVGLHVEGRYTP